MKIPARLLPLLDVGIIDDVIRPLMSGKEAAVYLVEARGAIRVAKVYKDAQKRSFKHRTDYTEGRKVRNSRRQRAMDKRSKYGREEMEAAWRTAEVDAIRKLRAAGVAVPEPFEFYEGVLVMELIEGEPGMPAPRLIDVSFTAAEARRLHRILLTDIIKMLCAGVVHGDLSDFNVLLRDGQPVIIDFPQAIDPSFNNNAKKLFVRDVDNICSFMARFAPELNRKPYGREIWGLYEKGLLDPEVELTGTVRESTRNADVGAILDEIDAARDEAMRKLGERPPPSNRQGRSGGDDDWGDTGDWSGGADAEDRGRGSHDRGPRRDERGSGGPPSGRSRPSDARGRRGEPPPSAVDLAAEGTPRRRAVFVPPPPAKKRPPRPEGGSRPKRKGRGRGGPPRGDGPDGGRFEGGHPDGGRFEGGRTRAPHGPEGRGGDRRSRSGRGNESRDGRPNGRSGQDDHRRSDRNDGWSERDTGQGSSGRGGWNERGAEPRSEGRGGGGRNDGRPSPRDHRRGERSDGWNDGGSGQNSRHRGERSDGWNDGGARPSPRHRGERSDGWNDGRSDPRSQGRGGWNDAPGRGPGPERGPSGNSRQDTRPDGAPPRKRRRRRRRRSGGGGGNGGGGNSGGGGGSR